MRFASLDFETATSSRDSACSLGLCVVEDGSPVETRTWLIRPPGNTYSEFNSRIHGMGPQDTAEAPSFAEVIQEAWPLMDGKPLVAHNAAFDFSVLRNGLDASRLAYPRADYFCTLLMSRAHWPNLPGYALPIVLAQCGLSLNHHHADEDAAAAANIVLRISDDIGVKEIDDVAGALGVRHGRLDNWGYSPCSGPTRARRPKEHFTVSSVHVDESANPDHPFYDADVAFTGTLLSMTRPEAMQRVAEHGGRPRTTVSRRTEYLVVGTVEYRSLETGAPSSKMRKALALKDGGCPVIVLSESEFLQYL